MKQRPSKDKLYNLYWKRNKTSEEISKMFDVSGGTILVWLRENNIKIKTSSEANGIFDKPTKEKLYNLYWVENKSTTEIGEVYNVTKGSILNWIRKYNIDVKTISETKGVFKKPSKEILYDLYWNQNKTTVEIGKMLDHSYSVISKWLRDYGIQIKTVSEAHIGRQVGENSSNWQGGKSIKYCYKFNEECRESNRNKFNNKCLLCGKLDKDNFTKSGKQLKLDVHHVDYNKNQGCNSSWKLVPLCRSCHAKTSGKNIREHYEFLLTTMLYIREMIIEYKGKIDYRSLL